VSADHERLRDRLIHERELTSMLAKLIRQAIDAPTRNECLSALYQAQEIHFVWSAPTMSGQAPEPDADGKVTFRIAPPDADAEPYWCPLCGEKGLPDLHPEATCRTCGKQPYAPQSP
jgi:hypothetical protein